MRHPLVPSADTTRPVTLACLAAALLAIAAPARALRMRHLLALLVLVTSCGWGKINESDIIGSYTLKMVNGKPLPYQTSASDGVYSLQSAVLLLGPGGTFSLQKQSTQQIGTAAPSSSTETITGTWSSTTNEVEMRSTNPAKLFRGTYWERSLVYFDGGVAYFYRR